MEHETKPWHPLIMVCPLCGTSFSPEVFGLQVRLCPQCEADRSVQDRKYKSTWRLVAGGEEKQVRLA